METPDLEIALVPKNRQNKMGRRDTRCFQVWAFRGRQSPPVCAGTPSGSPELGGGWDVNGY